MDNEKDTYRLWRVRKTIMQVGVLVCVASSNVCNSYYIGSGAMAHILLESRGREAPEGECNIEPLHRSLYNN